LSLLRLSAATNDLSGLLQKGLFEEEANRNLDAAAQAYQALSARFDQDRRLAATAIFRLGEVYRKQGKTNDATAQYERIVREFADETVLATLSRQNLLGLGARTEAAVAPALSPAARQEQERLLAEEIRLVEQELAETRKQVEVGRAPQQDVRTKERELLQLRRQIAGLEVGPGPSDGSNPSAGTRELLTPDVEEEEIRRLQAMIQNSPDLINAPSGTPSQTPLCRAAGNGQLRVAAFLLDRGANINLNSPLRSAAASGHKAMVELLLGRGADANAADPLGQTPLHKAADKGFLSVTETLLAAKADPNVRDISSQTPLTLAAKNGFLPVAAALLASGADPNVASKVLPGPGYGMNSVSVGRSLCGTPLHFAAGRGDEALAALLLTNRADVSVRSIYNETPLDIAATLGRTAIAARLIAAGADVNATAPSDEGTPLHRAVSVGHHEVVKLLLEKGAKPNVTALYGQHGVTPLMLAASQKDAELVELLLKHKADPNLVDARGNTALLNAVHGKSPEVVRVLLAGGANPDTTNRDGYPVLTIAVTDAANREVAAALLEAKANVNAPDPAGKTPLHWAAETKRNDLVELFINAGADVNLRDKSGKTPLDYAKQLPPRPGPGVPIAPGAGSLQLSGPDSKTATESAATDVAALLRQRGALDDLPDFTRIRITRPGLDQPLLVFSKGPKLTNQFTLLETVMFFYARPQVFMPATRTFTPTHQALPFPDFGRILIRRPDRSQVGKEQEIKVSLLNASNVVDCAKDVPVEFGDVIEIPERVHALNEAPDHPVRELERVLTEANRRALPTRTLRSVGDPETNAAALTIRAEEVARKSDEQRLACLLKSVQLVVAGETTPLTVTVWQDGFLGRALARTEARAVLRSSSDLSRVKVTRRDARTGQAMTLTVDVSESSRPEDQLWLQDGDVIEVPDKP
jgi:ankyrin repeat protein